MIEFDWECVLGKRRTYTTLSSRVPGDMKNTKCIDQCLSREKNKITVVVLIEV